MAAKKLKINYKAQK